MALKEILLNPIFVAKMGSCVTLSGCVRELDEMFLLIQGTCFGIAIVITPEMGKILPDLVL